VGVVRLASSPSQIESFSLLPTAAATMTGNLSGEHDKVRALLEHGNK
jgi:hypothetical protein